MMSKHVTTTKGLSHFMLFLLRLLALALFIYSVSLVFTSNFNMGKLCSSFCLCLAFCMLRCSAL